MPIKIFLVSLGCAKNLVNSEQMLALLQNEGMKIVKSAEDADVAIVNTCGFIEPAQAEAIEVILKLAGLKEQGVIKGLVVTGCLTERYKGDFLAELPEVDAALGTGSYTDIVAAVKGCIKGEKSSFFADSAAAELNGSRTLLTPKYSAYLRIAEGCDNRCAYCVIPFIRGPFRSRPMEDILAEARQLAADGAREIMVIAQDITRYGTDIYGERRLHELTRELCKIDGIEWVRLHYMYPDELDDVLLETIAEQPKVLKYFDIPLQHVNDRILKDMNRRGNGALIRERIEKIRAMMPQAVIRTSLIVGFPGETEQEFEELYTFLTEYRLERAGVFCYSREEGSAAYDMPNQIDEDVKEQRRNKLFELQEQIMNEKSSEFIGKTLEVLCCGEDETGRSCGRSYMDSPDVDGVVYFENSEAAREGAFVSALITDAQGAELYGRITEEI